MRVVLEIASGSLSGTKIWLWPGQLVDVGRAEQSAIMISQDPVMSPVHFAVQCDYGLGKLRDLESQAGTFVNGQRVTEAVLSDGDQVLAGATTFIARLHSAHQLSDLRRRQPVAEVVPEKLQSRNTQVMGTHSTVVQPVTGPRIDLKRHQPGTGQHLYALVDAATERNLVLSARELGLSTYNLLVGDLASSLAEVAPYLIHIGNRQAYLACWANTLGKNAGVLIESAEAPERLLLHLRHQLFVKESPRQSYLFRFYDPRVLRQHLSTCTLEEMTRLFRPIRNLWVEDVVAGRVLLFTPIRGGLKLTSFTVDQDHCE